MTFLSNDISHDDTTIARDLHQLPLDALEQNRRLPSWVKAQMQSWGERFCLPEWDDDEYLYEERNTESYRVNNGWKGKDLCHSKSSPVRVSHYAIQYASTGTNTTLTGIAHFTPQAESHAGYCHGGSMTSVMDDVIGWTAFHVTGKCIAWSGFTAQVNVSLKRPIAVGSIVKIMGRVTRWEGRKVWVEAALIAVQDDESEIEHCTAEGLVILKKQS